MGLAQSACTYVLDNTRNYRRKRKRRAVGWRLSSTEEDDSESDSTIYASKRYIISCRKRFYCHLQKFNICIQDAPDYNISGTVLHVLDTAYCGNLGSGYFFCMNKFLGYKMFQYLQRLTLILCIYIFLCMPVHLQSTFSRRKKS